MDIPGCRQAHSKAEGPRTRLEGSLILDARNGVWDRGGSAVKDACVPLLPDQPGDQKGDRCQPVAERLGGGRLGESPPVVEGFIRLRWPACRSHPGEDFVPDLAGEGTLDEEVLHGFHGLVAKEASGVVLKAAALQSGRRPAAILVSQPMEEFDAWRRPVLPNEFPGAAGGGAVERGVVTGSCRVGAIRSPLPGDGVRPVREVEVSEFTP